jgi:predicted ATPase
MLTRLELEHFKTWTQAKLDFAPITGLFGTNSSGKSSLIQFLLLLKQTRDATDRRLALHFGDERTRTRLGSFEDAVQDHNKDLMLAWRMDWIAGEPVTLLNPSSGKTFAENDQLSIEAAVTQGEWDTPWQERLSYALGERRFSMKWDDREITTSGPNSFAFRRNRGRPVGELGVPTKGYLFPDTARYAYQNGDFLADLELAYEEQLDQLFYLGPLREPPKREYIWSGAQPQDVGDRGEYAVEAMLAATREGEKRKVPGKPRAQSFEAAIGYWLQQLGLIDSFAAKPVAKGTSIYRVTLRVRPGAAESVLTDVGFGVSQVLPVVVLLHYVPEGATVILEQPEIHLHPLAQAGLADLFIHVAQTRKVQIFVESHSEHLLLRLQRRIAEEQIDADQIRLYFASATGAASRLDPLQLDDYGNILNWPDKFMGDAFGETAIAELARLRRMEKAG